MVKGRREGRKEEGSYVGKGKATFECRKAGRRMGDLEE